MNWPWPWKQPSAPPVVEAEAEDDPFAVADREYRAANDEWLTAWNEVRGYYDRHRRQHGFKPVGDRIYGQITIDPELTRIASRENHARFARNAALERRDQLKPKPLESRHIAGVLVP